jgi:hypothetical protein
VQSLVVQESVIRMPQVHIRWSITTKKMSANAINAMIDRRVQDQDDNNNNREHINQ